LDFISLRKINSYPAYYEDKEVSLVAYKVAEIGLDEITIVDTNGAYPTKINLSKVEIVEKIGVGDIVTIKGRSFMLSKGRIQASFLHLHKAFYWRHFLSPIAIVLVAIIFLRQWKFDWKDLKFVRKNA
jgi:hypothetical protein